MPANARKDIVREGEIGTCHCWSRCVQRAFRCGYDPVTERDFDYRRGWIEDLLAYLAGVFAFVVLVHGPLGNQPGRVAGAVPAVGSPVHAGVGHGRAGLARAREVAQQRFHGISLCRAVFATAPSEGFT